MRRYSSLRRHFSLVAVLLSSSIAAAALPAYIDELNEEQVVDAYTFAQRHDQDVAKFFEAYEKQFPNLSPEIHVDRIVIRTPYYSVVLNSFLRGSTYPMSQARADYAANPYPFIVVVSVSLPFANPLSVDDLSKPDGRFWKQFDIDVSQNGRIAPRKLQARPLYSMGAGNNSVTGTEILQEFDVRDVASRTIQIKVTGPDRQPVSASFDLDELK